VHRLVAEKFPGMRVVAPRLEFCELAMDKLRMAHALEAANLATPRTWLASEAGSCTYPVIVKPRAGRGSRGFAVLDGPSDLDRYLAQAASPADAFIVQERLDGTEFTTSVVVGLGGPLLIVVPKEVAVKKGITQVGITREVPAIDALCRGIQERLRADGPFNVQLFLGADGVPRVIEVNPRYSTTVALTLAAGVNEVEVVIRRARGEEVGPLAFVPDLMMVRYSAQHYVRESEWRPIDLRKGRAP
jgi:carbamoyl-phosphate synthase large subunit